MSIFAGSPPGEPQPQVDPPLVKETPPPAAQPQPSGHPLTDGQILDMLDRTDR